MHGQERGRGDDERRRYDELLAELRTIIPGTQVLLAFLLTVPFSSRFESLDRLGKVVFTVSLMTAASAVVLFFAPTAYHRIPDRRDRRGRLRYGVRLAVLGMILFAVSITCAVFVVVRFLFDVPGLAPALAGGTGALALLVWLAVPMLNRRGGGESGSERAS